MYAQKSFDAYLHVPSTVSDLNISIGWGSGAPTFPRETVNAMLLVQSEPGSSLYKDATDYGLYDATANPARNTKAYVTVPGCEYWICVEPYVGDTTYTLRVWLTPRGGTPPAGTWYGKDGLGTPEATTDKTVTGNAYASDGEFYKDGARGRWHNVGQYWPGRSTNWNLYVCDRSDYVNGYWPALDYAHSWDSNEARLYTRPADPGDYGGEDYVFDDGADWGYRRELSQWYAVDPQTWSCTASPIPAGWPTDWPKPRSLGWTSLPPLWYTYSWPDDMYGDANRPGYFWANTPTALASKRGFSAAASCRATITWRYQGPQFSWVFPKGPRGGIARVKVDGIDVTPTGFHDPDIDQCSATVTYGSSVSFDVGGDAATWHTAVVYGTGRTTSTTTPKGYFIYHDAFIDPDDVTPAAENNYDGMTQYAWEPVTGLAGPSGGGFVAAKDVSSATAFTFPLLSATQANRTLTWQYPRGPRGGIQNVYINGHFVGTVDQYAPTVTYGQSTTWVDGGTYAGKVLSMPQGLWQTVFITGSGSSNSTVLPKGYFIYSDCFRVEGGAPVEAE